ncbi:unnamed protein product [Parascedosporium putredinis]|uniref:Uncharacterized protein n=1 Tax=Parascedosporium putredinis TaxID=1442378 RepID=A0A9P1H7N8_9PEZI|nr:unnamed protein product [Parascedosporium putredinis]CAI7998602.1 unnamed protein product [Parascedosporium putredinis]
MSLSVRQLNADASFLLSFEPPRDPASPHFRPEPFTVLTDPWITGPSKIFHPILALTHHRTAACISCLRDLAEPDLVIISQHKSDHCNEATLRQLPLPGPRLESWPEKITVIPKWEELSKESVASRRPACLSSEHIHTTCHPDEHAHPQPCSRPHPDSAGSPARAPNAAILSAPSPSHETHALYQLPPRSKSASDPQSRSLRHLLPHGISYRDLEPYVQNHLVPEAALPLTALLHCFDSQTALALSARAWISAHDGDKDISGLMTKMLKARKYAREEVLEALSPRRGLRSHASADIEVLKLGTGEEICLVREGLVGQRHKC